MFCEPACPYTIAFSPLGRSQGERQTTLRLMLWPATRGSGYEEQEFNAVRVQKSLAAIAIHTSFDGHFLRQSSETSYKPTPGRRH
jgi:hypothetical protein